MITFAFTKYAQKRFFTLPSPVQKRISKKLSEFKKHSNIFSLLKRLHHFEPATHRLRIGDYRLILELAKQERSSIEFLVLDVGDRKAIYK